MANNLYSKKVLEHFRNPRNIGKMKNPDGTGKVGNISCGDMMYLYIKVNKKIIEDIKFQTFGCVAAISTSSIITELAKGKTIKEALDLDKKEIISSLEGLPRPKMHCSVLASDALSEAIYDYLKKNKKEIPQKLRKKHERIKKEKEIIEEKYKEWVKTEEKMHEEE